MSDSGPERITVNFDLTADDYARYAAAVERRSRSWLAFNISIAVLFCAIPAAFLFRWLAAQRLDDTEAIEIVGKYSLFAFGLGIFTCWIGWSLIGWVGRRRYFTTQLDSLEAQTAELDHTGITVIRKGARSTYEWIRIPRCTLERSLLLVWITPYTAVAIPSRCFGSDAACKTAMAFVSARLSDVRAHAAQPNTAPASGST